MSNSPLVTYRHFVKNKNSGRQGNQITKIFVHHMAGNLSVASCGSVFDKRPASAHYGVNGASIGQYVDEADTAWHCGNWGWNTRSIGIELANDGGANWHVSDMTIETAITLIADICVRNGIKALNFTGDMSGNLCMHRWVCSTTCPGSYLASRFSYIAASVNKILGNGAVINPSLPSKFGELEEDGIGGPDTIGSTQRFLGTEVDFRISGQTKSMLKYYPAFDEDYVDFDEIESTMVKHLQWLVQVYEDGVIGPDTVKGVQKFLGVEADGIWGPVTMKAWQRYLNTHEKAEYPATHAPKPITKTTTSKKTTTTTVSASTNLQDQIIETCKAVIILMQNAKYGWQSNPNRTNIKKKGTCVSFVAVVLQILGYKKSGNYVWHNGKGKGTGKVTGANNKMVVTYMGNKKLSSLKGIIQKGDILLFDDNNSGEAGNGGHICIATGGWSGFKAYIWDMEPNRTCIKNKKPRTYSGSRKVLAIVRLKG